MMDIFNNREIAIAIWLAIAISFLFVAPSLKVPIGALIAAVTHRYILIAFGLMTVYVGLVVYGLYSVGLWEPRQLKATLIWLLFVASVLLFSVNKAQSEPKFFRKVLLENLKLVSILEFVVALKTYPIWIELLMIPIVTFLFLLKSISENKKEFELVGKLVDALLAIAGVTLIVFAVSNLKYNFESLAKIQTLVDFSLPPLLSFCYLPFLFVVALYLHYERFFIQSKFSIKDPVLRAFAKRRALVGFHFRTELLRRWARNLLITPPKTKQDIKESVKEVRALWKREKNPDIVPYERGWSPYLASTFLITEGLQTSDYHRMVSGTDEWYAASEYLEIGSGVFPNNIAYYVDGNETTAISLKLALNMNDLEGKEDAQRRFVQIARLLFKKALQHEMPNELENHLLSNSNLLDRCYAKEVEISHEEWSDGYSQKFIVRNCRKSDT